MGGIAAIILAAATKVGADVIGKMVAGRFGDAGGALAEEAVKSVAEKLGVEPDAIPDQPADKVEAAVKQAEAETPEIIAAWVEQQRETNRLMLAEMNKAGEKTWTWAWRPATMWGLLIGWGWYVVIVPSLNLVLAISGAAIHIVPFVDIATLLTVTGIYAGLYMGGHTIKSAVDSWAAARTARRSSE